MSIETDIAWAAGLFEGEGSIFKVKQPSTKNQTYEYNRMSLKMTDLDVIERFLSIVKFGKIVHQSEKSVFNQPKHYKKHYYWQLCDRYQIIILCSLFWPYLGKRRKEKIIELNLGLNLR